MRCLSIICIVFLGAIMTESKLVTKRDGVTKTTLDCSKFSRDLDVLRSFPYPVQINPFTTNDKTYATMNLLNQVETLYIVREITLPLDVFCLVHLHTFKVIGTRFSPQYELDDNTISTDLPREISRLSRLSVFSLVNSSASRLPRDELASLTFLTSLEVKRCGLLELPSTVSSLHNLRTLVLPDNRLVSLPESIGNLTMLEELNVFNNSISALPSSVASLANLTKVIISQNPFVSLQPLSNLYRLTEIQAQYCQLKTLPKNVTNLVTFLASYSNLDDISYLGDLASTRLTDLDLSFNKIDYVPPQISRFALSLTALSLQNNKLFHLPTELKLLTKLTKLNISYNFVPSDELTAIISSTCRYVPPIYCVLTHTPQNSST